MYNLKLDLERIELICEECGHVELVPYHCHKPMKIMDDKLVCWKGDHAACCDSSSMRELPLHHGKKMILKN